MECEIYDAGAEQSLTLLEAYDKGLLVTSVKGRPGQGHVDIQAPLALISVPPSPAVSVRREPVVSVASGVASRDG